MNSIPGKTVRLGANDNVVVAVAYLSFGDPISPGIVAREEIPCGHKVAVAPIRAGEIVRKYGQAIGVAAVEIGSGYHVHTHNMTSGSAETGQRATCSSDLPPAPSTERLEFDGYRRAGGRYGTRNYVGVIATVNCSKTVVHAIVDRAREILLPRYPNVDGLVPIAHETGCGMARDLGFVVLDRTMKGFIRHPNFGAVLVIGLGCEVAGSAELVAKSLEPDRLRRFDIQSVGGTTAAIAVGLRELEVLLSAADQDRRERLPASGLIVGLQCGGSDGFSGITANPAMGMAVDRLVAAGGTAVLSETPEIFGAEHLLISRAATLQVADALRAKIAWWFDYAHQNGIELDNNPSPGNKQGGLTTILEKSLGAVAKGGQSPLQDVLEYGQAVRTAGLVFMDSPGFDPCSATGQVAAGANVLLFSTGRGSCFGCKPAPSIKLATNSDIYRRMKDDMDIDCGSIVSGTPMDRIADEIVRALIAVASGRKTKSEVLGYGDHEFVPWRLGAVL